MGALKALHAWRSFGVLLAEIITGDPPSKRFGLREPMCAHNPLVFHPHNTATHQLASLKCCAKSEASYLLGLISVPHMTGIQLTSLGMPKGLG